MSCNRWLENGKGLEEEMERINTRLSRFEVFLLNAYLGRINTSAKRIGNPEYTIQRHIVHKPLRHKVNRCGSLATQHFIVACTYHE
jgi:hypothetical protein